MAFGFFKKSAAPAASGKDNPYRDLTVKNIIRETSDSVSLVFEQPSEKITYRSGQFLTLILTIDGKEERRSYSFSSAPDIDSDLCVTVKRVNGGLVSNWLNDNLKAGDSVRVREATGQFTTEFAAAQKRHLVMLAGGSGITPIMSIIKSVLTKEPQSRCTLIYCNRNAESIIFKTELEQWENNCPGRLSIVHVLEKAAPDWKGYTGYLTPSILQEALSASSADGLEKSYWMCGPEIFMTRAAKYLAELSVPAEVVFKENFGGAAADKKKTEAPADAKVRTVTIRYDDDEHKVQVEPGRSILESALEQGIDLPFSCQSGMCTACRGKALAGKVELINQQGLSQAELGEGYVLTCVGRPLTDDVVIEIM